ncbi:MAG TPA: hypothetical protein PK587_13715 [Syntrophales bacterium]|nr:hypothetical protein [Syntrophales bacterium]
MQKRSILFTGLLAAALIVFSLQSVQAGILTIRSEVKEGSVRYSGISDVDLVHPCGGVVEPSQSAACSSELNWKGDSNWLGVRAIPAGWKGCDSPAGWIELKLKNSGAPTVTFRRSGCDLTITEK